MSALWNEALHRYGWTGVGALLFDYAVLICAVAVYVGIRMRR